MTNPDPSDALYPDARDRLPLQTCAPTGETCPPSRPGRSSSR